MRHPSLLRRWRRRRPSLTRKPLPQQRKLKKRPCWKRSVKKTWASRLVGTAKKQRAKKRMRRKSSQGWELRKNHHRRRLRRSVPRRNEAGGQGSSEGYGESSDQPNVSAVAVQDVPRKRAQPHPKRGQATSQTALGTRLQLCQKEWKRMRLQLCLRRRMRLQLCLKRGKRLPWSRPPPHRARLAAAEHELDAAGAVHLLLRCPQVLVHRKPPLSVAAHQAPVHAAASQEQITRNKVAGELVFCVG
mmetsp:Transcript_52833/g.94797  ORF Transcript_52833/g.94797 Transcript_52833/m.94797 type:complete len:245 (+) Transcript_52833:471-1205(+)